MHALSDHSRPGMKVYARVKSMPLSFCRPPRGPLDLSYAHSMHHNIVRIELKTESPQSNMHQCSTPISSTAIPHRMRSAPYRPPCCCLNVSKCLSTVKFPSMNRSTQFWVHVSSAFSSLPDEMPRVMHFVQHMSVRAWTSAMKGG